MRYDAALAIMLIGAVILFTPVPEKFKGSLISALVTYLERDHGCR